MAVRKRSCCCGGDPVMRVYQWISGPSKRYLSSTTGPTWFGVVGRYASSKYYQIFIENTGTRDLILDGVPAVALGGVDASDFAITTQPATTTITPGSTESFVLEFNPDSLGAKSATVNIDNNDPATGGTFTFPTTGFGTQVSAPWGRDYLPNTVSFTTGAISTPTGSCATQFDEVLYNVSITLTRDAPDDTTPIFFGGQTGNGNVNYSGYAYQTGTSRVWHWRLSFGNGYPTDGVMSYTLIGNQVGAGFQMVANPDTAITWPSTTLTGSYTMQSIDVGAGCPEPLSIAIS